MSSPELKNSIAGNDIFLFRQAVSPMGKAQDLVMHALLTAERTVAVGIDRTANAVDQLHRTTLRTDEVLLRKCAFFAAAAVGKDFLEQSAVGGTLFAGMGKEKRFQIAGKFLRKRNFRLRQFAGVRRIVVGIVAVKNVIVHLVTV